MRMKFLPLLVAASLLAACESTPDESASMSGDATASRNAAAGQLTASAPTTGVTSQPIAPSERPGSVEDFVVNVGDRVFFGFDRHDLTAEGRQTIENQVAWLRRYAGVRVTVEGHADERGTREYNLALGERRASAVRDYMIALGIDPARVRTLSYGKERPVDPRSNEEAWAKNRRAVTVLDSATVSMVR